jgi:dipeptidase D
MGKQAGRLKPERLWRFFEEISAIPRCSGDAGKISGYLLRFAGQRGLEHRLDRAGNIVMVRPARPGREGAPVIVLQGHVDMVCEKDAGTAHDFTRDPVRLKIGSDSVSAEGTTLGADNGIGVAAMLAVLDGEAPPSGKLECLFTVDEETGLTGASALDESLLQGRLLVNLDTEETGTVCIGCAGGRDSFLTFPLRRVPAGEESGLLLSIAGLKGGHSGADIHLGRANAIKLMAWTLKRLRKEFPFRIASITGGDKLNAIPREVEAVLCVGKSLVRVFSRRFSDLSESAGKEYLQLEPELRLEIREHPLPEAVADSASTDMLINLLNVIPHGVLAMSPVMSGLVETSTNCASVRTDADAVTVSSSHRSSVDSALLRVCDVHLAIAEMAGARIEQSEGYPGWIPNRDSRLLRIAEDAVREVTGHKAMVTAVHAGLECGVIKSRFPGMEAISIGPSITGAHSPRESVDVRGVETFWNILLRILDHPSL